MCTYINYTPSVRYSRIRGQSLFKAFFLFSAPFAAPPVADRLTALVVGVGFSPMPIPRPVAGLRPTLASAVPSGEGEVCRSLVLEALRLSFSCFDGDNGFMGVCWVEEAFRVPMGNVKLGLGGDGRDCMDDTGGVRVAGGLVAVGVDVEGSNDVEGLDDDSDEGVSNSTGLTRGVACMLVMSLARSQ